MSALFYYDVVCPYAYMAFMFLHRAAAFLDGRLTLKPILLGGLFKEMGVEVAFNSRFPLPTVTPLRVALVEPRVIDAVFHAAWADNVDVADDALLGGVLNKAFANAENLLERSQDNHIKEQLKKNTASAVARGVFGVPTFFVRDELVFGQDRFPWMRHEI